MTVGELREQVRRLGIGVRMEINGDGDRLDVVNEVSGFRMSVSEGGSTAATTLGIRTLSASTLLSEFNDGRGVQIADGQINPLTGLPDADRNVDFEVTLTDGSSFVVDLTPADTGTVADVLAKINADAAAAGVGGVFNATLGTGGNGIVFEDTAGGGGPGSAGRHIQRGCAGNFCRCGRGGGACGQRAEHVDRSPRGVGGERRTWHHVCGGGVGAGGGPSGHFPGAGRRSVGAGERRGGSSGGHDDSGSFGSERPS